jgi:hypothetical protein
MNITLIIAILEIKGIITRAEGEKILEHWNNRPQPTLLADAVEQVKEFVTKELPALIKTVTPAVEATAKNEAKKAADKVVEVAKTEAERVAEQVAADAAKAGEKK